MRRCVAHKIKIPTTKVKATIEGQGFVTYKSCVSHKRKIYKGNLIKLHRKVKHNEKVCRAQPRSRS